MVMEKVGKTVITRLCLISIKVGTRGRVLVNWLIIAFADCATDNRYNCKSPQWYKPSFANADFEAAYPWKTNKSAQYVQLTYLLCIESKSFLQRTVDVAVCA